MSWVKRRGHTTPNPPAAGAAATPPVQMYDPNQHATQSNQWQTTDFQTPSNWFNQTPQNQHESYSFNQPPQQQQQQQYWQQNYNQPLQNQTTAENHYNQQPGFYNMTYNQQNSYGNPSNEISNSFAQNPQSESDTWNWGWGDEDNSNVQTAAPLQSGSNSNTTSTLDSFNNDKTWEWSISDNNLAAGDNKIDDEPNEQLFPKVKNLKTLQVVRNENLTPQWSIESQMSQDSSDDIVESGQKLSRSSTVSQSPLSGGHDANFEVVKQPNDLLVDESGGNREILAQHKDVNPYKQNVGFSNRVVNKLVQQDGVGNQGVNLETLPDNSEQPDLHTQKIKAIRSSPNKPIQQWQENVEIAPMNDRNQYLETGQLSDIDLNQLDGGGSLNLQQQAQESVDTLPPPGLRRMVLGQIEQNESINHPSTNEEPPPGLSRMVLGQTESNNTTNEPLGVRMIPGESSSPETTQNIVEEPRSATIGADTPPHINRSETIGADNQTNSDSNRRQSIEGQQEDAEVNVLTNTVRDLTVGENTTDGTNSVGGDVAKRKTSRQESSESERDPSPRDQRRGRSRHGGEERRSRDRYSPDSYNNEKKKTSSSFDRGRYHRDSRRYEQEDTDYYSEKEREKRGREDYERKYGSLKREKERRRRDYERGGGGGGRRDYYYGRYDDEYENDTRPSSRSDSMHESYRERTNEHRRPKDRDRERDYHRRHRDPHGYMQMYGYDPYNPYYQQYQYYENLRRTNPQAYAEWYRKYYQQAASGQTAAYGTEDRASVHSGRSSANDDVLTKDRYTRQSYYSQSSLPQMGGYYRDSNSISGHYGLDTSSYGRQFDQADSSLNLEDTTTTSQRLTPAKYATAHVKVAINSGVVVRIPPHYPLDGQSAAVDFGSLQALLASNDEYNELVNFPGPLIRGVTHKKTIIEYCESKIRQANGQNFKDCQSYILMWELLILLIRQNGMVVGTDIAELLMKDGRQEVSYRPPSVTSNASNDPDLQERNNIQNFDESVNSTPALKEEFVTNKFREYLINGSGKEALEWAMKHGLWGHALFLASKLDKRTYANVMMRFANGLTMNDPLQTLYQLLSGRIPAAVTCVADEKWGDWKPHLAMILSNTTQRPELDRKAITTLADTLFSRGSLYAAQFCYLMAQVDFGRYGQPDTKLALLGSNHTKMFKQFATNEAIFMTEIYEYACSLNESSFLINEFQPYKYLLATRLADMGLLEKSLAYLERLANVIVQNPTAVQSTLIDNVVKLADRLKFYDLTDERDDAANFTTENYNRPDNSWLKDLISIQQSYSLNLINQQSLNSMPIQSDVPVVEENWQQQQQNIEYEQYQQQGAWNLQNQSDLQRFDLQQNEQPQNGFTAPSTYQDSQQQQQQQSYWGNQEAWSVQNTDSGQYNSLQDNSIQPPSDYWGNTVSKPEESEKPQSEDASPPQISMPNQPKGHNPYADDDDEQENAKKHSPNKAKQQQPAQQKQEKTQSAGWFGGIWSKLAPKPKNQMKLPDDKNPTIVWDSEKKRWINLEEENNEGSNEIKPPPKMSELFPKMPSVSPPGQALNVEQPVNSQPKMGVTAATPSSRTVQPQTASLPPKPTSQQNMFKLQRSRNLKKSYVDVFNPGGKNSEPNSLPKPETTFSTLTPGGAQMNFFVPQPVANANAPTDFLTPAAQPENASQLSRWSSASSLSREVQSYIRHKPPPVPR